MAYYTSYGAAGEVTGSCHLLTIGKIKILIDCGMFQGEESELNFDEFGFDPEDINYLIVTHAHLDHIGRIPLLVKKGFNKKIISTQATSSIAQLMLKNSAGILETKKKILYNTNDAEQSLQYFGTYLECDQSMVLDGDIKITFKNAGHILGAVSVKFEFQDEGIDKSVVFSGDIGQKERVITAPIQFWHDANYLFVESTYGASNHNDLNISIEKFKKQILKTLGDGGTIVIPSFALERTQEILYLLKQMSEEGQLEDIPVFLDAPLAINVTKTFMNYPNLFSYNVGKIILDGGDPFNFKELNNTYSKEESKRINEHLGAKIIIAGSGMCEGGRVNYHLIRYLSDKKNLALFVGFQVNSTLGKKISSGLDKVKILDIDVNVKAKVSFVSGFSAHADQKEILEWIDTMENLYCVYLIHGETNQLQTLKRKVKTKLKRKVHIVKMGERIHL
ncbi:MAG: MBL fold metallo-hydrolase [Campylobacterota bacterium]|nr:MBL fold metallo-hydrolase [Campylobacterota bacterium]